MKEVFPASCGNKILNVNQCKSATAAAAATATTTSIVTTVY